MERIWNHSTKLMTSKRKQPFDSASSTKLTTGQGKSNTPFKRKAAGPERSRRVFVAMSGGVDSSVAALLLKKQGYDVTGVFMKCYNIDGCAVTDAEDARRVANHLNIPFYVFDFEKEYKKRVVKYMIDGYKKGITPNPDVMCNKAIKFDLFLKEALKMDADYIATGHYARLKNEKIFMAIDTNKDQSYFLWALTKNQLKYCLFPIGDYKKPQVREIARKANLPTADKKDSQGICFLGKFSLTDFLKKHIPLKRGDVLNIEGIKMGEHDGTWFYTVGQRHGLNLNAKNKNLGIGGEVMTKPHYIVSKNIKTNTITVAENDKNPILYSKKLELTSVNIINFKHLKISVLCRFRYRQPLIPATIHQKLKTKTWKLIFTEPQKFIAKGQSAVFYSKKGELLGGGIIAKT